MAPRVLLALVLTAITWVSARRSSPTTGEVRGGVMNDASQQPNGCLEPGVIHADAIAFNDRCRAKGASSRRRRSNQWADRLIVVDDVLVSVGAIETMQMFMFRHDAKCLDFV